LRAIGLVLMPPAMAVVIAPLVPGASAGTWAIVVRFLLFGVGVVVLCRLGRSDTGIPPVGRYVVGLAVVGFVAAALAALFPTAYTTPLAVAVLAGAAATEEIVFRAELPSAIAAAIGRRSTFAIELGACVAAQLSFAATHLALHGGISTGEDALQVVRLFGCGACAAILYRVGGLVPAALFHAFVNYATYTSRLGLATYPSAATIVVWTAMVSVALVAVFRLAAVRRQLEANDSGHDRRDAEQPHRGRRLTEQDDPEHRRPLGTDAGPAGGGRAEWQRA
jgi:hypothetical protein